MIDRPRPLTANRIGHRAFQGVRVNQAAINAARFAASMGGAESSVPPDAIDMDALMDAVDAVQREAEVDAAAAREAGDQYAYASALRRLAEAIYYGIGMSCRIPLAYQEHYERALKARERMADPRYAEYLKLKSQFEGQPDDGPDPNPLD